MTLKRVAYVMSRFPKLSETFVLYEMAALAASGVEVEVFPMIRHQESVQHSEAADYVRRARYQPLMSAGVLASQVFWLVRRPAAYAKLWWDSIRGTIGAPHVAARTLAVLPQAAHNARVMQRLGITHVHAHFANHPSTAAWAIHRLTGIPYSFTAHAHDLYEDQHLLCDKVREAAFVVAISDFNRALISRSCAAFAKNVHVIHCGIDADLFHPETRSPSDVLRIVCVGSLEAKKGQSYLVEACRLLMQSGRRVECALVGDGPDRDALDAQVREAGLEGVVQILGAQSRENVLEALRSADVAVLPSVVLPSGKMEGIPVALMEAMACGLPVVSTQISGIPELIENGVSGLLVPERDARALADALADIVARPDRAAEMGERGRERVEHDFNLHASAMQLVQLMRETA